MFVFYHPTQSAFTGSERARASRDDDDDDDELIVLDPEHVRDVTESVHYDVGGFFFYRKDV